MLMRLLFGPIRLGLVVLLVLVIADFGSTGFLTPANGIPPPPPTHTHNYWIIDFSLL